MNNTQRVIEESNTKINKILVTLTDITGFDHSGKFLEAFHVAETELKTHISETIRQVLTAIEEEVEKLYKDEHPVDCIDGVTPVETYGYEEEYNSALKEVKSLLKQAKDSIK